MNLSKLLLLSSLYASTAFSFQLPEFLEHPVQKTDVKVAYMNIYSGPGRGFPIFYVAEKGDEVEIIRAHTEWFQVKTPRGVVGWAYKDELLPSLQKKDSDFEDAVKEEDYETRKLELGLAGGSLSGNSLFTAHAAWRVNDFFSTELALSNAAGDFSTSNIYALQLLYHPFKFGHFEPHFILGAGQFAVQPKAGLVGTKDSHSAMTTYGLGLDYYWSDRFIMRADWQNMSVYSSAVQTDSDQQWSIGISYFLGSDTRSLFENAFNQHLDVDDFELSTFVGLYNLEDFGSSPEYGFKLAYHISEDVFIEGTLAQARIDDAQFRDVGLPLFPADGKDALDYYDIGLGVNILPGEIVFSNNKSVTTQVYLIGGAGMTRIVDQEYFTTMFGMGVRIMPWQKWALHMDARDHIFDSDILGGKKTTHNLDWQFGVSYFL